MTVTSSVEGACAAFARQSWAEAYAAFVTAAERVPLDAADHERMAVSAYLIGQDGDSTKAWEAAQRAALTAGDLGESARCAFWLSLILMLRGQTAQAAGWLTRTERLIARVGAGLRGPRLCPDPPHPRRAPRR